MYLPVCFFYVASIFIEFRYNLWSTFCDYKLATDREHPILMKIYITNENALSGCWCCCFRLQCHFIRVWLWWTGAPINACDGGRWRNTESEKKKMTFNTDHMNDWLSASLVIYEMFIRNVCVYVFILFVHNNGFNSCVVHGVRTPRLKW